MGSDPANNGSWPAFATGEPWEPEQVITVYDTQGRGQGRVMPDGETQDFFGFMVQVRAKDHAIGWTKASAIRADMAQQVYQQTVYVGSSSYLVHAISLIGQVLALGKETPNSKRSLFTVNAQTTIRQLT